MEGGERPLAISKGRKQELVELYSEWINKSLAMFVTEYIGLNMNAMNDLRSRVRDAGGEFHIVKNTLVKRAFEAAKLPMPEDYFDGPTAIGFAFEDAPHMAKALSDFAKESDFLKIRGGYLVSELMSAADVIALAELPPLPIMRATLLGTIMAPATRLARTLSEPGRQIASVLKAYSEQGTAPEAA
jgi:large subunit ribosomal protein L10